MPGIEAHIAIVGLSCRMPGASDANMFWANIFNGIESIAPADRDDLVRRGVRREDLERQDYVGVARTLKSIEDFDAEFFGMTPRDARYMDPQQRIFLECCHEALEDAGYAAVDRPLNCGVFAGSAASTYMLNNIMAADGFKARNQQIYEYAHGNDKDYITTNASYRLNLTGPSMSINTACSSTLVCVVEACKSLLQYECDLALAGGVRIEVPSGAGYRYRPGGILSPDGRCSPFDSSAQGTCFADGAGVILLKRLEDALQDGDPIHAVIIGFAMNNDGRSKAGYAAPSLTGQQAVIREALEFADVAPETIGYVEAHGTGTIVGDPIEFAALSSVFTPAPDGRPYCGLGSVKANVGHLNTAAGAASLIKAVSILKNRTIPPQINFKRVNPAINLEGSAFFITTTPVPLPDRGGPHRVGVSSFGVGGTNVHLVLEEAPPRPRPSASKRARLLLASARTPAALKANLERLSVAVSSQPDENLGDIAHTLRIGRRHHSHRAVVVSDNCGGAARQLLQAASDEISVVTGPTPRMVFMIPGQAGRLTNPGHDLYQNETVFRAAIDACIQVLDKEPGGDRIRQLLVPGGAVLTATDEPLPTGVAQPLLFSLSYALAKLWQSFGVRPDVLIGHSLGEYVAACLSGVLSLRDALRVVSARGRIMEALPPGAMLAVALDAEALARELPPNCALAASNGPGAAVAGGTEAGIEALANRLRTQGIAATRLPTASGFHSNLVEPAIPAIRALFADIQLSPPQIPYISNVTGTWITTEQATDPEYWIAHMRGTVRFAEGLELLLAQDRPCVLVETGPGNVLSQLARRQLRRPRAIISSLRQEGRPDGNDNARLLAGLGQIWAAGIAIDATAIDTGTPWRRVNLPTYAFDRARLWLDPVPAENIDRPAEASATSVAIASQSPTAAPTAGSGAVRDASADIVYLPSWRRVPALPPASATPRTILFFHDEAGQSLVTALRDAGHRVIRICPGASFLSEPDGFRVAPSSPEDFSSLAQTIGRSEDRIDTILFGWGLNQPQEIDEEDGAEPVSALALLAQSVRAMRPAPAAGLTVLTAGACQVTGSDSPRPAAALLLGAARVLADELEFLTCRCLDLDEDELRTPSPRLLTMIDKPSSERLIALRQRLAWAETFEKVALPAVSPDTLPIKRNGTYLVTGAFGGIGKAVTRWLSQVPGVRLMLVSRRRLPSTAEERAAALATANISDTLRADLDFLAEVIANGARVYCIAADVADLQALTQGVAAAKADIGRIDGVFHLAGLPSREVVALKSLEMIADTIAPKVQGTLNLERIIRHESSDFVVLYSSISSILGGLGRFDYSGANAFLDAFALRQAGNPSTRWIAIGWDIWRDAGMAVDAQVPESLQKMKQAMLANGLSHEEGLDILQRILALGTSGHFVISRQDLEARRRNALSIVTVSPTADGALPAPHLPRSGPPASTAEAIADAVDDATSATERRVIALWREYTGHQHIGRRDNFFDLGGDSLLAVKIVAAINAEFGTVIGVRDFIDSRDPAELASLIDSLTVTNTTDGDMPVEEIAW